MILIAMGEIVIRQLRWSTHNAIDIFRDNIISTLIRYRSKSWSNIGIKWNVELDIGEQYV